jgi:hypothetical protein
MNCFVTSTAHARAAFRPTGNRLHVAFVAASHLPHLRPAYPINLPGTDPNSKKCLSLLVHHLTQAKCARFNSQHANRRYTRTSPPST